MCIKVFQERITELTALTDSKLCKWTQANKNLCNVIPALCVGSNHGEKDKTQAANVALPIILEYSLSLDLDAAYLVQSWARLKETVQSLGCATEEMELCANTIASIYYCTQPLEATIQEAKTLLAPSDGSLSSWWAGHNREALQQRIMAQVLPVPVDL